MKVPIFLFFSFVSNTVLAAAKQHQGSSLLQLMQYGEKASNYLTPPVLDLSEMVVCIETKTRTKKRKTIRHTVPVFLGNLHGWEEFIKGCDPSTITILNLSLNSLSALDPGVANLSLKSLHLRDNLFKKFPPEALRLTSLVILDLSYNQIEDIPDKIGLLINLKKLYCQHNRLHSLPVSLTHCTALEELRIDHNNFSDGFPDFMFNGSIPKLAIISLEANDAMFHGYGIECSTIAQATYDTRTAHAPEKIVRATYYGPSHPMSTTPGKRYAILVIGNDEVREDYHRIGSKKAYKSFTRILKTIKKWDKKNRITEEPYSDDETEEDEQIHHPQTYTLPITHHVGSDDSVDYNYDEVTSSNASCSSSSMPQKSQLHRSHEVQWKDLSTVQSPAGDVVLQQKKTNFLTSSSSYYGGLNLLAQSSSDELPPPANPDIDAEIARIDREVQNITRSLGLQNSSSSSAETISPREPAADSPRDQQVSDTLSTAPDSPIISPALASEEAPERPKSCDESGTKKPWSPPTSYETPSNCPF